VELPKDLAYVSRKDSLLGLDAEPDRPPSNSQVDASVIDVTSAPRMRFSRIVLDMHVRDVPKGVKEPIY
jgi:hypothetical protein